MPIIDADVYDGQVVIVSEYADGGSLADKLKTERKFKLTYNKEDASFIELRMRYYVETDFHQKIIEIPTDNQTDSKTIEIEITKYNLDQILQSGKISQ